MPHREHVRGVECILAVVGAEGPVKRKSVKRRPPVSKYVLEFAQSGSAERTAIERLNRRIKLVYLRAARVLSNSVVIAGLPNRWLA
eukprot:1179578-Prorocentrum_minimum.AAC.1